MANPNPIEPASGHAVELIRDLAQAAQDVKTDIIALPEHIEDPGLPRSIPVVVDRKAQRAYGLKDLFESYRTAPSRRRGTAKVETLASFIDLTNRHKDEHSALFAKTTWPDPKLTAVIDYHTTDRVARFGSHRIEYAFPVTDELKAWIDGDGKPFLQLDFAAFIEEHAAELASPFDGEKADFEPLFKERFANPHELIDLSRNLEVYVGAKAKRGERLQSGEREAAKDTALPAFEGEPEGQ